MTALKNLVAVVAIGAADAQNGFGDRSALRYKRTDFCFLGAKTARIASKFMMFIKNLKLSNQISIFLQFSKFQKMSF